MIRFSMRPVTDTCIECKADIDPKNERNYIVWDEKHSVYRRECATCHDKAVGMHLGRKFSNEPIAART